MKGVASVCLMGMALMTCADVILRATINKPIFGSEEIVSIFAVLAIGFALSFSSTVFAVKVLDEMARGLQARLDGTERKQIEAAIAKQKTQ